MFLPDLHFWSFEVSLPHPIDNAELPDFPFRENLVKPVVNIPSKIGHNKMS